MNRILCCIVKGWWDTSVSSCLFSSLSFNFLSHSYLILTFYLWDGSVSVFHVEILCADRSGGSSSSTIVFQNFCLGCCGKMRLGEGVGWQYRWNTECRGCGMEPCSCHSLLSSLCFWPSSCSCPKGWWRHFAWHYYPSYHAIWRSVSLQCISQESRLLRVLLAQILCFQDFLHSPLQKAVVLACVGILPAHRWQLNGGLSVCSLCVWVGLLN